MQVLENKKAAVAGAIILVFLSMIVGAARTLGPLRREAQQAFYTGVEKDGFGIANDLEKRLELSYNLVTVARRYLDDSEPEVKAVLDARSKLADADSVKEKYLANLELTDATQALSDTMQTCPLSDTDEGYRRSIAADLNSRNDIISRDGYNGMAAAYNEKLSAFPASLFGRLAGLSSLELFG